MRERTAYSLITVKVRVKHRKTISLPSVFPSARHWFCLSSWDSQHSLSIAMPVLKTARKRKAKEKAVRETRKISISKRVKAKRTISSQDCEIPPTSQTITCRICTDAKSLQELPRDVKTTEPLDSQTKLDIPEACQSHLGVSNPFGPVCKSCITSYLTAAMELKSIWNIGCLHPGCSEPWPEHFIILYLHGTPKLDLYHRKKLEWFIAQNPNFVWCSNPNCEAGGIMDKTAIGFPKVACDACKTRSCALCRVAWHEGVTCQEFRESHQHVTGEEQKALEFLAKKGYKRCPRCQFAIQKSEGCNNMWCK